MRRRRAVQAVQQSGKLPHGHEDLRRLLVGQCNTVECVKVKAIGAMKECGQPYFSLDEAAMISVEQRLAKMAETHHESNLPSSP